MRPPSLQSLRFCTTLCFLVLTQVWAASSNAQQATFSHLPQSQVSCQTAIQKALATLKSKRAYVPYQGMGRGAGQTLRPRPPSLDSNYIQDHYFDIQTNRKETLTIPLAGEANYLWGTIFGSPLLLSKISAGVMASCPSIGLIVFPHWWEERVEVGHFYDGTARVFIEHKRGPCATTRRGQLTRWGYFYNPYGRHAC